MARIYDVVCPRCGEIYHWCKYDSPIDKCDFCGCELSYEGKDGEVYWKDEVLVFGVGSTNLQVSEHSKKLRKKYLVKRNKIAKKMDELRRKYGCTCVRSANEEKLPCKRCGRTESEAWWATCSGFIIDGVLCNECHFTLDDCVPKSERKKILEKYKW